MRSGTPGANNVNLLVQMLLLNYMALNGEQGQFANVFPNHGLGDPALLDRYIAFALDRLAADPSGTVTEF